MRLLPILGILAVSTNFQCQPQADFNRQPVSEEVFATIADRYEYDRSQPLDTSVIGVWPHRRPYIIEKVEFSSINNERVPAYFTYPKDSIFSIATRHPAVLLLHGANDFWGKNEDWSLEWMDILAREGWCVLVADFYGFGERKKAGQKPQWWVSGSYIQAVTDQRRGIDFLFSRPEVDTTKVALMGGSMGGYFGTFVAGLESRFTTVVLTVTGTSSVGATDDALHRFRHILNFAPRVSAPVLMVNATGDGRPFGEELYNAMPEPKQQIWYESEHYLPPREYNEDILNWLHEHLD